MIPTVDELTYKLANNPELTDLYLQHQECRANSARAELLAECAAQLDGAATLAQANEARSTCASEEAAAAARLRNATRGSLPRPAGADEWQSLAHDRATLEYACAALCDAAAAAGEAARASDTSSLRYWREESERRRERFDTLRRRFYQQRVLSGPVV
jgi:hypothetical protein